MSVKFYVKKNLHYIVLTVHMICVRRPLENRIHARIYNS